MYLGKGVCYAIVLVPVSLFTISCLLSKDQDLQLNMAKWFSLGFSFLMATVLVGIIMEGVNCPLAPSFLFFMALVGINVIAAILHFDFMTLFCGVIYFLFIPRKACSLTRWTCMLLVKLVGKIVKLEIV